MRKASNIQNFLGNHEFNKQYKKFDFVYNPADGLFYYAKQDNFVANFEIKESNASRFSFLVDGPVYEGAKTHYLIDSQNNMSEYTKGQTIKIEGSNVGNDGEYKIIEIDANQVNHYHNANHQIVDFLDATQYNNARGTRFSSGWFLFGNDGSQYFEWNVNNFSLDFRAYVDNYGDLYNAYIQHHYLVRVQEEYNIVREISYPPEFLENDPHGYYLIQNQEDNSLFNDYSFSVILRVSKDQYVFVLNRYQWVEDWGEDHYTTNGKSEGRIVPLKENANFFSASNYGDVSYNIVNLLTKALWFEFNSLFVETVEGSGFHDKAGTLRFFTKKTWTSKGEGAVWKYRDFAETGDFKTFGNDKDSGFLYVWWWFGTLFLWESESKKMYQLAYSSFSGQEPNTHPKPGENVLIELSADEQQNYESKMIDDQGKRLYDSDGNLNPPVEYDPDDPDLDINFDSSIYSTRLTIQGVSGQDAILNNEPQDPNNIITISQPAPAIDYDIASATEDWSSDEFFFDADYGSSVEFSCDNIKHQYGNGYYINQPRGINSINAKINLKFKNRSNRESSALVHFVENHLGQSEKQKSSNSLNEVRGIKGFRWGEGSAFFPYKTNDLDDKQFLCLNYSHSLNFQDSNDVDVSLVNYDTSILNKSKNLYISGSRTYDDAQNYYRNDVVFIPDSHQYYYCIAEGPVVGQNPEVSVGYWSRDFVWSPSLGLKIDQSPRLNLVNFGHDYTQVHRDGVNEKLLILNLEFSGRNDNEARAILHFLEHHYGCIPFKFFAPAPYHESKNFVCSGWTHTYEFNDNHNISAKFEQFPFDLEAEDYHSIYLMEEREIEEYKFTVPDFLNLSSN